MRCEWTYYSGLTILHQRETMEWYVSAIDGRYWEDVESALEPHPLQGVKSMPNT